MFGGATASLTAYESIATVSVGSGGTTSVNFTSIPSTYKHLQIRYIAQLATGTGFDRARITLNANSSAIYNDHSVYGNGSSVSAGGGSGGASNAVVGSFPYGGYTNIFGTGIIDILDYQNTNKYKTVRILSATDTNGAGEVWFQSFLFSSTAAITSFEFGYNGSAKYNQYTHLALYGIKG